MLELDAEKKIFITFKTFKNKKYCDIREFYEKDDKLAPSYKGISLTKEQWEELKKNFDSINKALED